MKTAHFTPQRIVYAYLSSARRVNPGGLGKVMPRTPKLSPMHMPTAVSFAGIIPVGEFHMTLGPTITNV
jgi:hypothetical protein